MRHARFALALTLSACAPAAPQDAITPNGVATTSTPAPPQPDRASVRRDLHCTQAADGDEAACKAKVGCGLSAPLSCRGTPPAPEDERAEQEAYEASTYPCQCVCEADVIACKTVP